MASVGNNGDADEEKSTGLETMPGECLTALEEFRNNWQYELKSGNDSSSTAAQDDVKADAAAPVLPPSPSEDADEQQAIAEGLYHKAVELEQRGKVYDALPLYRKAVQLVPDIEFSYYEQQKLKLAAAAPVATVEMQAKAQTSPDDNDEPYIDDLYEKFRLDLLHDYGGKLLLSSRDASVLTTERHIADLPPELLLCILRWVVSAELDLRSLEQCAAVSRGMYLCARDDEIWRLACMKVWGSNRGSLDTPAATVTPLGYSSWRQMFLNRDRLLFNGCYISKTTYLRMGENSFQDQFYRPVQLVEYFRYLRFLPDGQVLMITTADEPSMGVGRLRNLQQLRPDVLRGHYHLFGNIVSIVLNKNSGQPQRHLGSSAVSRQRRGSVVFIDENSVSAVNYRIEFRIASTAKRKFVQLQWLHYAIEQKRNKSSAVTEFDLVPSKYPQLWFSPVRSYHQLAEAPLA